MEIVLLGPVLWIGLAVMVFFLIYWAVRLAIRHENQRVPPSRVPGSSAASPDD